MHQTRNMEMLSSSISCTYIVFLFRYCSDLPTPWPYTPIYTHTHTIDIHQIISCQTLPKWMYNLAPFGGDSAILLFFSFFYIFCTYIKLINDSGSVVVTSIVFFLSKNNIMRMNKVLGMYIAVSSLTTDRESIVPPPVIVVLY